MPAVLLESFQNRAWNRCFSEGLRFWEHVMLIHSVEEESEGRLCDLEFVSFASSRVELIKSVLRFFDVVCWFGGLCWFDFPLL